ncbi:hypothetical protein A3C89_02675 [Candidatus Kaiserbacteria bacterium RIFCSPHIGHO2_02_FULL_50_50]|uniref:RNA polymerase sigma-70 region 4 domain-containing protein n=1 Tax=Candidatus Kaiserbacteria bacterium RIFCSPHIGHO2_02_FULL_50_50 TaxID=1798492 RepID=A0A1F6DD91_9BACT|nr:MAG: hypothetical protein A3C89_02675 [Candidatus Kaiserbacteria bacterium RIFCSPHIGHO2_02_FULL_50_50]
MLTFKPQQVTSKFLKILNDRTRDVLEKRYGLTGSGTTHTLESIGELYGITRERVRQIENHGVQTIQRSKLYDEHASIFDELEVIIRDHGMIVDEAHLLDSIAARKEHRPHILLLLNVGKQFARTKENQHFTDRWHIDTGVASAIEDALHTLDVFRRSITRANTSIGGSALPSASIKIRLANGVLSKVQTFALREFVITPTLL